MAVLHVLVMTTAHVPLNCALHFLLLPFKNVCCYLCATYVEKSGGLGKQKEKQLNNSTILLQR